jgi:cupin fold WbuC family metalloprotein
MTPFKTALPAVSGDVFSLTDELIEEGLTAARESPRKRIIQPIHRTQEAIVQRMLNFMLPGTYLRPHLHPREEASETVQVLRGELGFIIFEEDSSVRELHRLSAGSGGLIDIEPEVWHGLVVLAPDTVILEIKRGPYDLKRDKIFADWAPAEEDPEAASYRESLERLFD